MAAVGATILQLGVDVEVLLWLAPALLLAVPVATGRFLGEGAIDARRARRAAPRRRCAAAAAIVRTSPGDAPRRDRLIAFRLAERGPPWSGPRLIA